MQETVSHADVLTRSSPAGSVVDSPPPGTRVHVREAAAQPGRVRNPRRPRLTVRCALRSWWVWTARPVSLRAMWRLSRVDTARVPARTGGLTRLWRLSNGTDRLLMLAAVLVVPTFLAGLVRWLMTRPSRRFALYLLGGAAAVLFVR